MEVRSPKTKKEFEKYYDLRWRILRAPWNQPRGTEKDDLEDKSIHIMVYNRGKVLGVGRAQFNSSEEAQIRYMATEEDYQGKGLRGKVLEELEKRIKEKKVEYIVLNARENAIHFYEKHGYHAIGKAPTMFGVIKHKKMRKDLQWNSNITSKITRKSIH